jgi:hypothetical protein
MNESDKAHARTRSRSPTGTSPARQSIRTCTAGGSAPRSSNTDWPGSMPTPCPHTWKRVGNETCPAGSGSGSTWPSRIVSGRIRSSTGGRCAPPGRSTSFRRGWPREALQDLLRPSDAGNASATHSGPRLRVAPPVYAPQRTGTSERSDLRSALLPRLRSLQPEGPHQDPVTTACRYARRSSPALARNHGLRAGELVRSGTRSFTAHLAVRR